MAPGSLTARQGGRGAPQAASAAVPAPGGAVLMVPAGQMCCGAGGQSIASGQSPPRY